MLSTVNVGKRGKPLFGNHFFCGGLPGIAAAPISACRATPEKIHLRPATVLLSCSAALPVAVRGPF
jgi:hypothetical protein